MENFFNNQKWRQGFTRCHKLKRDLVEKHKDFLRNMERLMYKVSGIWCVGENLISEKTVQPLCFWSRFIRTTFKFSNNLQTLHNQTNIYVNKKMIIAIEIWTV